MTLFVTEKSRNKHVIAHLIYDLETKQIAITDDTKTTLIGMVLYDIMQPTCSKQE